MTLLLILAERNARFKNSVNTNLILFDEVFDSSLDSAGSEELMKILRYVIKDANVFVITHKTENSDKFSRVLEFVKEKGFSHYSFLMLVFSLMCFLQMLVYYDKLH